VGGEREREREREREGREIQQVFDVPVQPTLRGQGSGHRGRLWKMNSTGVRAALLLLLLLLLLVTAAATAAEGESHSHVFLLYFIQTKVFKFEYNGLN